MPMKPRKCLRCACDRRPRRNEWPLDQNHRQRKGAGRLDLRNGGVAACIFRQDDLDTMLLEEPDIIVSSEGAARANERDTRELQRSLRRLDQAYNIAMVRCRFEIAERETAEARENGARGISERPKGGGDVRGLDPDIARLLPPSWPLDCEKRRLRGKRRLDRMAAHLRCERMRGVDEGVNTGFIQITDETGDTSETAAPRCDRLSKRARGAAGKRQNSLESLLVLREQLRKVGRLRRAAEEKDTHALRL